MHTKKLLAIALILAGYGINSFGAALSNNLAPKAREVLLADEEYKKFTDAQVIAAVDAGYAEGRQAAKDSNPSANSKLYEESRQFYYALGFERGKQRPLKDTELALRAKGFGADLKDFTNNEIAVAGRQGYKMGLTLSDNATPPYEEGPLRDLFTYAFKAGQKKAAENARAVQAAQAAQAASAAAQATVSTAAPAKK